MESECEGWSPDEQQVARRAFDLAYEREIGVLIDTLRQRAGCISSLDAIWDLHDYLSFKRHDMDGRFDFRYPSLLFVFASFLRDGLLNLQELEGLSPDKLAKISAMSKM